MKKIILLLVLLGVLLGACSPPEVEQEVKQEMILATQDYYELQDNYVPTYQDEIITIIEVSPTKKAEILFSLGASRGIGRRICHYVPIYITKCPYLSMLLQIACETTISGYREVCTYCYNCP